MHIPLLHSVHLAHRSFSLFRVCLPLAATSLFTFAQRSAAGDRLLSRQQRRDRATTARMSAQRAELQHSVVSDYRILHDVWPSPIIMNCRINSSVKP